MELVPIKVKIGKKVGKNGGAENAYPPFNQIPAEIREYMDWCFFIEQFGGWQYDPCGFGESDDVNPDPRCQFGYLLVPENFANEAESRWPKQVEILNEKDFAEYYDRVHANDPEEIIDTAVLEGIRAKHGITGKIKKTTAMSEYEKRVVDPDDDVPGIRKNKLKTFEGFKEKRKFTIKKKK